MVAAIDCSDDVNSDTCREFEVMGYPTIRYFPPKYEAGEKKIGKEINKGDGSVMVLRETLVENLIREELDLDSWPSFQRLDAIEKDDLFTNLLDSVKYIFFIYETNVNSTLAAEVILDLYSLRKTISVQRIAESSSLLDEVSMDKEKTGLIVIDRDLSVSNIPLDDDVDRIMIRTKIRSYLDAHHIIVPISSSTVKSNSGEVTPIPSIQDLIKQKQDEAIRDKVSKIR
jgi:thiol oxidase